MYFAAGKFAQLFFSFFPYSCWFVSVLFRFFSFCFYVTHVKDKVDYSLVLWDKVSTNPKKFVEISYCVTLPIKIANSR